ncbi:putative beta-ketoacyl-[acyl-carrier-protein] synthase II [Helianthus annuus]|uniref:beta-ketoacyl-[acyl-carrier-protein] synthase I n=1 Tax=Helianthus annuus TaxID=4232 RepID=A0A9K3JIZ7_HELAN|nr:putative beta-ketoacyl-[acyl-carrier-protein] synthase II [Helianthus annuus]KAJ0594255.1 putative beta-ketoacyl-[acyl-carrier-protein] synthase II [Helianthus annuus]KAJ0602393.1 putative beta-ketoacyl-[acyl-carrier-protein] synthase II [Helianthus annuus]KAJ0609275.1 putative beta-ketoacyl-[acyl-carrier-protein] synthase II [Helianthus annuus]KAJ0769333.1 putative beta-ketoacyl-[acyl-carrier-protein] synthase II [Helianthus annuus]
MTKCNRFSDAGRLMSSIYGSCIMNLLEPCEEYYKSKPLSSSLSIFRYENRRVKQIGKAMAIAVQPAKEPTTKKKAVTIKRRVVIGLGEIKSFSANGWIAPKLSKRVDKFMLYLLTAGKKALENGGVTYEVMKELDITKCGVIIESALDGMKIFQDAIEALRVSYKKMNPFCGWMGPNYSISTACATSNYCILNVANHIIRGDTVSLQHHCSFVCNSP